MNREQSPNAKAAVRTIDIVKSGLTRRYRAERRFRFYGLSAILLSILFLALLFASIVGKGYSAFWQTHIKLDVFFDPAVLQKEALVNADYSALIKAAVQNLFPEVDGRQDRRLLNGLVSVGADYQLRGMVLQDPGIVGRTVSVWVPADDEVDLVVKGRVARDLPEGARRLSPDQLGWLAQLESEGRVRRAFNTTFLTSGDSREPEQAGILGAAVGSFLTLVVTLVIALPLGVAAAIYLEEFAPQNRWTEWIEVNINNLAAVPSIVFGLLGLSVFLGFLSLPRSAPLVGGLTLALMTLPTLIIAGRSAIKAVPPGVREAARGLGASPLQVMSHHVLPLALPGILTGTILGMARALGETAPLLMIGMVAFVVDIPGGFRDAATALPVQIFLWADSPERGFVEKTSGAILVLIAFLIVMNGFAIWLRQRFEKRW